MATRAAMRRIFREVLLNLNMVKNLCGTRVYHQVVPGNGEYPCILYHIVAGRTVKDLSGYSGLNRWLVHVRCMGRDVDQLTALSDAIAALEGPGTRGLRWVWHDGEADGFEHPVEATEKGLKTVSLNLVVWM
jgi:hypothetical protein